MARPSVLGFFRPRILVPPELLKALSPRELRQVVVHEMEHLHRADDWTNLLQKVGLVLFPLNPVLLWVERRLCAERELASGAVRGRLVDDRREEHQRLGDAFLTVHDIYGLRLPVDLITLSGCVTSSRRPC